MVINTNFLRFYKDGVLIGSNSWQSFINYKLLNAENLKFDCDSSTEAKRALEKIYGDSTYTDTLISPQSFVTLYLRYFHSDLLEYNKRYNKLVVPNISELKKQMINEGLAKKIGAISNQSVWAYFSKKNNIKVHESMLKFLQSVYTLPNFSCVCRGFNLGRVAKTQDNFIVALYHIYDYFINRNIGVANSELRYILAKFLSGSKYKNTLTQDKVIDEVQRWLTSFSNFAEFINTYNYQDFLENPTDSYSKPKEIWKGMFEGKLEPSKEEFIPSIEFFTNAIKSRGNRMSKAF